MQFLRLQFENRYVLCVGIKVSELFDEFTAFKSQHVESYKMHFRKLFTIRL